MLGGAGAWRVDDRPGDSIPALDECLIGAARVVAAHGPALRGRYTRHAVEKVVSCGAGIGRIDDGPRGPVPALDECLSGAGVVVADRPAL